MRAATALIGFALVLLANSLQLEQKNKEAAREGIRGLFCKMAKEGLLDFYEQKWAEDERWLFCPKDDLQVRGGWRSGSEIRRDYQALLMMEALKMEIEVTSPIAGVVGQVAVQPNQQVTAGDLLLAINS